jgi:hypothetical protein
MILQQPAEPEAGEDVALSAISMLTTSHSLPWEHLRNLRLDFEWSPGMAVKHAMLMRRTW